jgi:hypothetical protein
LRFSNDAVPKTKVKSGLDFYPGKIKVQKISKPAVIGWLKNGKIQVKLKSPEFYLAAP